MTLESEVIEPSNCPDSGNCKEYAEFAGLIHSGAISPQCLFRVPLTRTVELFGQKLPEGALMCAKKMALVAELFKFPERV